MSLHPKHHIEYFGLRFFSVLFRILPYRGALLLAWIAAFASHFLLGQRRAIARQRIREIMGSTTSPHDCRRIAWLSWRALFFNAVDMLKPRFHQRHTFNNPSFITFKTQITRLLEESPNGVIIATLHYGNWELLSTFTAFHSIAMSSIARAQKNPLTNAYLDRLRSQANMKVIAHDDVQLFRKIIVSLKAGNLLGILPDIRNDVAETSFSFLGKQAHLGMGCARFARTAQAPILPVLIKRHGWARQEALCFDPIWPDLTRDKKSDHIRMMNALLAPLSAEALSAPENYFWYNKKWLFKAAPKAN
jgi:lauroyl/myristoyl acyltransferase